LESSTQSGAFAGAPPQNSELAGRSPRLEAIASSFPQSQIGWPAGSCFRGSAAQRCCNAFGALGSLNPRRRAARTSGRLTLQNPEPGRQMPPGFCRPGSAARVAAEPPTVGVVLDSRGGVQAAGWPLPSPGAVELLVRPGRPKWTRFTNGWWDGRPSSLGI